MKLLKKISALFIFLLMSAACFAQTNPAVKTSSDADHPHRSYFIHYQA